MTIAEQAQQDVAAEFEEAEQAAYTRGFRTAIDVLEATGADTLADAIDEAREANPDEPWEDE